MPGRRRQTDPHPTRRGRVAAAALLAAVLAGCAASPLAPSSAPVGGDGTGPRAFDLRSARIDVTTGEAFEIRLPSTPSTGYRWELVDPVPAAVRALGISRTEPPRADLVGAASQEAWRFEGAAPGNGMLAFVYRRPFDAPMVPPAQRVAFRVEVR